MSLSTLSFIAIYFPLLFLVYYNPICKSLKFKNIILLLASLGFYAFVEPVYILLLLTMMCMNIGFVKIEGNTGKHRWGNFVIIADILILLFFKYFNLLVGIFVIGDESSIKILFPIGLSYVTFREISYVVESRKNPELYNSGFVESALFISNFMTITAGPLGFWNEEVQFITNRKIEKEKIYEGIYRFVIGLLKKIIIADSLKILVDMCFTQTSMSVVMAWTGAIAYTLQIYFDFSGYSDMAIGIGKVFGFDLMENFNMPYTAKSISEFWKKWHISLTKWFTKYIYIPLGGSQVDTKSRHVFNLFIVWLCTGIWHGSNLTFIVWGLIYFCFQCLEKYTDIVNKINEIHLSHIYTMLIVVICWVIFRSDNLLEAGTYIGNMFGLTGNRAVCVGDEVAIRNYIIPIITGTIFSSSIADKIKEYTHKIQIINAIQYVCVFVLFLISIAIMIGRGYSAPMYGGF